MSLINCPKCEKEVSDQSEKCINCGYPLVVAAQNFAEITETNPTSKMSQLKATILLPIALFFIEITA